jgi:serine/threonine protein kinase
MQLLAILDYLYSEGNITHYDLNAENIMFDQNCNIKLMSYGLNKFDPELLTYRSPENIQKNYHDIRSDVWSLGVLLYYKTFGEFPFGENKQNLIKHIPSSEPFYPDAFSPELKDLLSQMLDKNPQTRISFSSIQQHAWFSDFEYCFLLSSVLFEIKTEFLNSTKKFMKNFRNFTMVNETITYRIFLKEKETLKLQCLNQKGVLTLIKKKQKNHDLTSLSFMEPSKSDHLNRRHSESKLSTRVESNKNLINLCKINFQNRQFH